MYQRILLFLVLGLITTPTLHSQNDSVLISSNTLIKEGLFLTHNDFRYNKAILKNEILTTVSRDQLFFLAKVMDNDSVTFKKEASIFKLSTSKVWGFYQNNTLYINFENRFYRVPVFGAICYFPAIIETYYNTGGFYDPFFNGGMGMGMGNTVPTREVRDFLMDFNTGKIMPYSAEMVEELLQKNKTLYDEFMKLKRRQRREQASRYIRKFNEQQAIYFFK